MASEVIKLNLIPKGEMPVFHASQFDTGRLITCELYRGEDAYSVPEGYTVELHCRKVDNNIVTMASTLINDNVVTFTSTEQLTACNGKNLCEVAILDEGYRIGTLNFILEVEIDPLKGGITSTSEIHNLETQIEEITTEIIGENYYNKTEVDNLLDTKADADSVYTIGEVNTLLSGKANAADVYTKSQTDTLLNTKADSSSVYTKSQTDVLLAGKADVSDLPDMTDYYTKTATDALLDDKANAADVYTKTQTDTALATKADKSDTYTKEQVNALIDNIFPTFTASGNIATFTTALTKPLVSVTAAAGATTVTACGVNLFGGEYDVIYPLFLPAGTVITASTAFTENAASIRYYDENRTAIDYWTINQTTPDGTRKYKTFTLTQDAYFFRFYANSVTQMQIELGSTPSAFHPYTGNTVPVAEATTLVTLSGVNNVFADVGEVTVQYKYMSM